ncbi:TlpA family protein disulfide reductase [Mucilaginibacter achroorhodeus]|uniref:TlpA family protein disulfide reductase n=2 Tax=Mucilaginibacter achroorhodeus TaxID=2599294 RepID=A0A563U0D8_9SPHI|nr:TlpA family protein disulfide reductase [Mucilaginibacter achroorhodeus]
MKHDDSAPDVIAVSPMTDEFLQKQAEEKASLDALINKPAPDFILTDLAGKKWKLNGLKGKTVVLNFWFTTCPACIQEMPELNELAKSYKNASVVFLALGRNDAKEIKRFLTVHPFNYTHLQNADAVGDLYKINSFPTSMVIDPQGVIRFVQIGGRNISQQIVAAINKIDNK